MEKMLGRNHRFIYLSPKAPVLATDKKQFTTANTAVSPT